MLWKTTLGMMAVTSMLAFAGPATAEDKIKIGVSYPTPHTPGQPA